jgi:hypothetical protein
LSHGDCRLAQSQNENAAGGRKRARLQKFFDGFAWLNGFDGGGENLRNARVAQAVSEEWMKPQ